jgi:DNA primase
VENVVASSGTSLTTGQIKLIHRFTNHITVLYDGDPAGIKASIRGIDMLLEEGMNVKVVLLPHGDDPDSFARKHHAADFRAYISENEVDFIRFKTKLLLDDAEKDPIKRAELIGDMVRSLSVIPDSIVRSVYVKECSQLLHVEEKLLILEIAKQFKKPVAQSGTSKENTPSAPEKPADHEDSPLLQEGEEFYRYEQLIIQILVRHGEKIMCYMENEEGEKTPISVITYIVNELQQDDLSFHNPLHRRILAEAAGQIHTSGFTAERYFITHSDPDISRLATDLVNDRYQLSKYHFKAQHPLTDEERLHELVPMLTDNFKYAIVKEELKHIRNALQVPETVNDPQKCNSLMQRYKELQEIQILMAKRLGDRVILPE